MYANKKFYLVSYKIVFKYLLQSIILATEVIDHKRIKLSLKIWYVITNDKKHS